MEITVNNNKEIVRESLNVKELIEEKGLTSRGIGVALNDTFIPQSRWQETELCQGDNVVIISAAYGG